MHHKLLDLSTLTSIVEGKCNPKCSTQRESVEAVFFYRWAYQFLERFRQNYFEDVYSGCFIWLGVLTRSNGYGKFNVQGKLEGAHRVAWQLRNGPIPKGIHVCQKCDNTRCVNPQHLFLGTPADNSISSRYSHQLVSFTKAPMPQLLMLRERCSRQQQLGPAKISLPCPPRAWSWHARPITVPRNSFALSQWIVRIFPQQGQSACTPTPASQSSLGNTACAIASVDPTVVRCESHHAVACVQTGWMRHFRP